MKKFHKHLEVNLSSNLISYLLEGKLPAEKINEATSGTSKNALSLTYFSFVAATLKTLFPIVYHSGVGTLRNFFIKPARKEKL